MQTTIKKVIFTMGGKGGTGKTTLLTALAEWYSTNGIDCRQLDLDTENKVKGSFSHFFPETAKKIDIQTPAGLDAFIDCADQEAPVILADLGSGSGKVTAQWFNAMYENVAEILNFTAVGLVTSDPASVESVLSWAAQLQDRVSYVIVLNKHENDSANFAYWENTAEAQKFRQVFHPRSIIMDSRLPNLQHALRNHGITLGRAARRECTIPELAKSSLVIRAQAYRRQLFNQFDSIKESLLP
jgi:MinD-like ATPase involved in chromosome partitioning or flagellar assembly